MFLRNKVFSKLKGLTLTVLFLFPLLSEARHLIKIEPVTPFSASVTTSSTTFATYRVKNISTIPLLGIEDQSILPQGMTRTSGTTCAASTPLPKGDTVVLFNYSLLRQALSKPFLQR